MNEDTRLKDLCAELPEWICARIKAAYWYGVSDGLATVNVQNAAAAVWKEPEPKPTICPSCGDNRIEFIQSPASADKYCRCSKGHGWWAPA